VAFPGHVYLAPPEGWLRRHHPRKCFQDHRRLHKRGGGTADLSHPVPPAIFTKSMAIFYLFWDQFDPHDFTKLEGKEAGRGSRSSDKPSYNDKCQILERQLLWIEFQSLAGRQFGLLEPPKGHCSIKPIILSMRVRAPWSPLGEGKKERGAVSARLTVPISGRHSAISAFGKLPSAAAIRAAIMGP
jgi:hypothetical protein